MKIGYTVEGSTDRALLHGLRSRWCESAELVEGRFRGTTHLSIRREIKRICIELRSKGAQLLVFMTDANEQQWLEVKQRELARVPDEYREFTIYGVPDRNVECWLRADAAYLARELGVDPDDLERAEDPKGIVEGALRGITTKEREQRVSAIVQHAPVRTWLERSPSFEGFYEDARDLAQRADCSFPNERGR